MRLVQTTGQTLAPPAQEPAGFMKLENSEDAFD
jgi:hypothetical protein